jgi:diaminopimelate decarboxylase
MPLLPHGELRAFVEHFVTRRQRYLDVLADHPAPLYILETAVLEERARQFQQAFRQTLPAVSFYYAVKSNNHPAVAATLLDAGFGLDVSSGMELEMALSLGARDIVFSGPGKTRAELELACHHLDRVTVLMDSFGELERLAEIAARQTLPVRAGVRLTTNPNGLWRKFGIPPADLGSFLARAASHKPIAMQGLQFHTSWNLTPAAQIDFIRLLGTILASLPLANREQIKFIDIGGGYWPPQGDWLQEAGTPAGMMQKAMGHTPLPTQAHYRLPALPIETFAAQLGAAIREHLLAVVPCRICFEPGRWLCNDAMHLLLSVIDKKQPDLVITDAGTNTVGWERFESDYFPILNLSRPALEERQCDILGALCTPHDVWGYNYWGLDIQPGDILLIPTQGAYTYSLRQQFIKPLPEVVIIRG